MTACLTLRLASCANLLRHGLFLNCQVYHALLRLLELYRRGEALLAAWKLLCGWLSCLIVR